MLSKEPSQLEMAVLDAIKLQLLDTFKKVSISCAIEEREVVIRISIPEEIMRVQTLSPSTRNTTHSNLDAEAQAAASELLGEE